MYLQASRPPQDLLKMLASCKLTGQLAASLSFGHNRLLWRAVFTIVADLLSACGMISLTGNVTLSFPAFVLQSFPQCTAQSRVRNLHPCAFLCDDQGMIINTQLQSAYSIATALILRRVASVTTPNDLPLDSEGLLPLPHGDTPLVG